MKRLVLLSGWWTPLIAAANGADVKDLQGELDAVKAILDDAGIQGVLKNNQLISFGVPLIFFLFLFGVVFVGVYWRYKQNQEKQQTIRLMVEKGVQVPPELIVSKETNAYHKDLRRGLILIFLGIALPVAMLISQPHDKDWIWGLIPFVIGAAYLVSAKISRQQIVK